MADNKLVLWKTKRQRWLGSMLLPIPLVLVGPIVHAVLPFGDWPIAGAIGLLLVLVLSRRAGNWWVERHGGEWITRTERLQRLLDEAVASSLWLTSLANLISTGLIFLASISVFATPGDLIDAVAKHPMYLCIFAIFATAAIVQTLTSRRQFKNGVVTAEQPPPNYLSSELRRVLPKLYLAWIAGMAIGVYLAVQLDPLYRFVACFVIGMSIAQVLLYYLFARQGVRPLYAEIDLTFRQHLLVGITVKGGPCAIYLAGIAIVFGYDGWRSDYLFIALIGIPLIAVMIGLVSGMFAYFSRRFSGRRQQAKA